MTNENKGEYAPGIYVKDGVERVAKTASAAVALVFDGYAAKASSKPVEDETKPVEDETKTSDDVPTPKPPQSIPAAPSGVPTPKDPKKA